MNKNVSYNVKKAFAIILGGLLMEIVCFFFAFFDFRNFANSPIFNIDLVYYVAKAFMIFAFVFFGFGLFVIAKSVILYPRKVIEFNDEFFVDRSSYIGGGKIKYSDIEDVYIRGGFLCIRLKNEEEFLKKQNLLKRLFMSANKALGYEYITITDALLNSNLYEIEKTIKNIQ